MDYTINELMKVLSIINMRYLESTTPTLRRDWHDDMVPRNMHALVECSLMCKIGLQGHSLSVSGKKESYPAWSVSILPTFEVVQDSLREEIAVGAK